MRILNKIIGIVKAIIRLPKQVFFFTIYGFSKGKLVFYVIAFGTQLFLRSLIELPIVGIIMKPFLIVPERAIYIFLSRRKASDSGISCLSLIDLGVHNIRFKKTRSFITIGGMAIGIGSIVFLVSLGYGAQRMVVNRVARLDELKQTDADTARAKDQQARDPLNQKINHSYYTSSKFFKSTITASLNNGFRMGVRESIGLIFAEMWFEFKEQIPILYAKYKNIGFEINRFLEDLQKTITNIYDRVKSRFKDILESFKNSAISGVFSSISTTILNIFLTTAKSWG